MTRSCHSRRRGAAVVLALALGALAAPARADTKITLGHTPTIFLAPVLIAQEKGYFAKHGLEVERQPITLNSYIPAIIQSGSVTMAIPTSTTLLQAASEGLDIVAVQGSTSTRQDDTSFGVVVRPGADIKGPQDLIESHRLDYQNRRDLVVGWLRDAKGITCHKPEGAFYVFPNIAGCIGKTTKGGRKIETDTDFVTALLEERHVATVQGAAYGMSPYFRISYATDLESLRDGCKRIQEFCADLR